MDPKAVLAAFDEQVRRHAAGDPPYGVVERTGRTVRVLGVWGGVTWSRLDAESADETIAAEINRFATECRPWEWKHYSYDEPADLPERLVAAGFTPEPPETMLVAETERLLVAVDPPAGIRLVDVIGEDDVETLVAVHDEVFGGDHTVLGAELLAGLHREPPTAAAVIAMDGDRAVAGGRIEFGHGSDFASLWGGGTVPEGRGKGIFRSLVAYRAAQAAARGFRYLQVDASAASRPILERLGFVPLAVTTPFQHPGTVAPPG